MLIDLHVHTAYSEGFTCSLEDTIARCREAGIGALLLAECDVVPDLDEVRRISQELEFPIFVGVDVDASDGRVIAVPADPTAPGFQNQSWAGQRDDFLVRHVIEAVADMDGAVLAAHPYLDDGGPYLGDRIYDIPGFAGVEVACGVKRHLCNDLALEAASSMAVPTVGGSDTGPEGQRLGSYATAFVDEITTQEELVAALLEGAFWAVELRKASPQAPRKRRRRRRGGSQDDSDSESDAAPNGNSDD